MSNPFGVTAKRRRGAILASALVASLLFAVRVPADTMLSVAEAEHQCGPSDRPEPGVQGDVPRAQQESNEAFGGYNCGLALIGHATLNGDGRTPTGNANMAWAGDCAYVAGAGALFGSPNPTPGDGVAVIDVRNPRQPRHVRTLRTPGATATLETLHAVKTKRHAILVVGQYGNDHWPAPEKPMDIYDVRDCANPKHLQTVWFPENIHNLTISGNARYVFATQPLQVVDLKPLYDKDPKTEAVLLGNVESQIPSPYVSPYPVADVDDPLPDEVKGATTSPYISHEAWPSYDGTKLYLGGQLPAWETFTIVDISQWLQRDASGEPVGRPRVISQRSGRGHSIRTATIGGRRYALHSEESVFVPSGGCVPEEANPVTGPAEPWLTDITDEADPVRVSQFGLAINQPQNCPAQADSGVHASVHYHDVDDEADTTFVMASMWNAGLRVFDVRDPAKPTEVAYFNPADVDPGPDVTLDQAWGHVRYIPKKGHIWFATDSGGFWVLELEPQLRRHLGLDAKRRGRPPRVTFPLGRPGTMGAAAVPSSLRVDTAQYYCTLSGAMAAVPSSAFKT